MAPDQHLAADQHPAMRTRSLSIGDWLEVLKRAARETSNDNLPLLASALAYSAFFAIPATLLVLVGAFSLVASPSTITDLMERIGSIAPREATDLLGTSLQRLEQRPSTGLVMTFVGLALALWSSTSAMTAYMTAVNGAYGRKDGRSFLKKRLVAFGLVLVLGAALLLLAGLLILGPHVEQWVASAVDSETLVSWLWWSLQWPILVAALLIAFSVLLYFGPDIEHRRWRILTPGSVVTLVIWLVASVGLSIYASRFGSYNKTWGSLSVVIVTLTWLWLTSLALLFGAEVNAEADRLRRERGDEPTT